MPSLIERLFPIRTVEAPAKAETGSGLFALLGFAQLETLSTQQNLLMAEAESLFHRNTWVAACERAITSRIAGIPYHIEDSETDEEVDGKNNPVAAALIHLLDHPSPRRTRRQLWGITGRHMGLAGNGFWYLNQRDFLAGTPLEILYINPIRMTPATDEGGNLIGWIMDHPQNPLTPKGRQPVPFELEEIIHFPLDEPDNGYWGIGIAETTHSKIELSRLVDRHASITVASGGRLAGIISPKQGGQPISDEGWAAIIRDYRNITSDPDSAKRVQVMKSPVDFQPTAMNATEMQLPQLSTMSRDDTLAAWSVPLSQLGIVPARGLNSGETPKYEEAQLWQGAIAARTDVMREKIQTELVDRFAALGLSVTIELEMPSFDDLAPLFDNAVKATNVPLTNDERRAFVSMEPLDDKELGAQVYIASSLTRIDEVLAPLAPIVPGGGPAPATPNATGPSLPGAAGGPATTPGDVGARGESSTAKAATIDSLRRRTELRWEPRIRRTMRDVLIAQRSDVADRIVEKHAHLTSRPRDVEKVWDSARERKRMSDALDPLVQAMTREVAIEAGKRIPRKKAGPLSGSEAAAAAVRPPLDASYIQSVQSFLKNRTGERITRITDTRRAEVAKIIARGVEEGLGPLELSALVREDPLFDEYAAERIARTETMFAYNDAALSTYRELGAEYVEALDGDEDEECSARVLANPWTVEDAFSEVDHPNGTLDWVPVVSEEAVLAAADEGGDGKAERPGPAVWAGIEAMAKAAAIPLEIPAPIVNVAAPPPAEVIVNVDNAEVAAIVASLKAELRRPRKITVLRDEAGVIVGTEES
jgi:phage portal protein BeeE